MALQLREVHTVAEITLQGDSRQGEELFPYTVVIHGGAVKNSEIG